jgi:hypothetical protein
MLPVVSSLVGCGCFSEQIKNIIYHIKYILDDCGNSVNNVKKIFDFDGVELSLKLFETMVNAKLKGSDIPDDDLYEMSKLFDNYTVRGFNTPSADGRNGLFSLFEKINVTKRLQNLFTIVEPLKLQSDDLKGCVNDISLSILWLYCGQEPPVSCIPVLKYCSELKNLPSPSEGYDFPRYLSIAWDKLINLNKILNKN